MALQRDCKCLCDDSPLGRCDFVAMRRYLSRGAAPATSQGKTAEQRSSTCSLEGPPDVMEFVKKVPNGRLQELLLVRWYGNVVRISFTDTRFPTPTANAANDRLQNLTPDMQSLNRHTANCPINSERDGSLILRQTGLAEFQTRTVGALCVRRSMVANSEDSISSACSTSNQSISTSTDPYGEEKT
jgi:hypothetical protein